MLESNLKKPKKPNLPNMIEKEMSWIDFKKINGAATILKEFQSFNGYSNISIKKIISMTDVLKNILQEYGAIDIFINRASKKIKIFYPENEEDYQKYLKEEVKYEYELKKYEIKKLQMEIDSLKQSITPEFEIESRSQQDECPE